MVRRDRDKTKVRQIETRLTSSLVSSRLEASLECILLNMLLILEYYNESLIQHVNNLLLIYCLFIAFLLYSF